MEKESATVRHAAIGETTVCGLPYLDLPATERPSATWVLSQRAAARADAWKAVECEACLVRLGLRKPTESAVVKEESDASKSVPESETTEPEPETRGHVFDAVGSVIACEAAIDKVDEAASAEWKAKAFVAVARVCERYEEFTTDTVWALLDAQGTAIPREPRAMGAIMRKAVTAGLCLPTDRTSKSVRVECHRRPLQVWRSKTAESDAIESTVDHAKLY